MWREVGRQAAEWPCEHPGQPLPWWLLPNPPIAPIGATDCTASISPIAGVRLPPIPVVLGRRVQVAATGSDGNI